LKDWREEKYKDIRYSNLAVPVEVDCVDAVLLVELDVVLVDVTRVVVVALDVVAVVVAVPGRHWPN
jgi:hypothetical protein